MKLSGLVFGFQDVSGSSSEEKTEDASRKRDKTSLKPKKTKSRCLHLKPLCRSICWTYFLKEMTEKGPTVVIW